METFDARANTSQDNLVIDDDDDDAGVDDDDAGVDDDDDDSGGHGNMVDCDGDDDRALSASHSENATRESKPTRN